MSYIRNHLYFFNAFVFLLFILHVFWPHPVLIALIGALGMVMVVLNFALADRVFKIIGVILLSAGIFFFSSSSESLTSIPGFFAENIGLLFLISMLPWMNSVVKAGRYNQLLQGLLGSSGRQSLGSLYVRSQATMVSLAAFLNLTSVIISQDLLVNQLKTLPGKVRNRFIFLTTLRGYSMALPWSPLEVLLVTAVFVTGVNFLSILPWMILIAVLGFIVDASIGKWRFRNEWLEESSTSRPGQSVPKKKLAAFITGLVLFLAAVVFVANVLQFDFLFAVTITIFPFAWIWAVIMKRSKSFLKLGWPSWVSQTNHLSNFIVLLVPLSFFTESLNVSPYLDYLQQPIVALDGHPLLIMLFIQFTFLVMTLLGIHPLAVMGIFGGITGLLMETMPTVTLTVLLASCAIATVSSAPYGLIITMTSVRLRVNPYRIVLTNLPYSLIYGFIGVLVSLLTLQFY
ncbi:hypothetical protein [Halobacillus massiliensis]|uniref:hypothetical protein n=1 Tax=Halobacillus massiliensis TaxID=1926286 RepID=UPI0009E5FD6A|nr:hypothetical protein [Halobacillus massiliensis]